jgi:hypothetical protein
VSSFNIVYPLDAAAALPPALQAAPMAPPVQVASVQAQGGTGVSVHAALVSTTDAQAEADARAHAAQAAALPAAAAAPTAKDVLATKKHIRQMLGNILQGYLEAGKNNLMKTAERLLKHKMAKESDVMSVGLELAYENAL